MNSELISTLYLVLKSYDDLKINSSDIDVNISGINMPKLLYTVLILLSWTFNFNSIVSIIG